MRTPSPWSANENGGATGILNVTTMVLVPSVVDTVVAQSKSMVSAFCEWCAAS